MTKDLVPDQADPVVLHGFPMSVNRKSSRGILRVRAPLQEEVLVPIGAVQPPRVGVPDLVRKLASLEAKLRESEQDRAGDAELIGNLLGEIGDRDRRIRALEAQIESDGDRIRALEIADQSQLNTDDRVSALEEMIALDDVVFAELLHRLSERSGTAEPLPIELHDLLAVTLAALELARTTTSATNDTIEQVRLAIRGGPQVEAGLAASLQRGQEADAAIAPVDKAVGRVVDRLREIERRERELSAMREELLADSTRLIGDVRNLGGALGRAARPAERDRPPPHVRHRR